MYMKPLFKNAVPVAVNFVVLIVVAKIIGLVGYYYLPKEGISKIVVVNNAPDYENYGFTRMFNITKEPPPPPKIPPPPQTLEISNFFLKATYYEMLSKKGFVLSEDQRAPTAKPKVINIGETHAGGKLVAIDEMKAVFVFPDGERWEMKFKTKGAPLPPMPAQRILLPPNLVQSSLAPPPPKPMVGSFGTKMMPKKEISKYLDDMNLIWKDISIKTYKEEGKLKGYIVGFIKPDTPFAQIGLEVGDIITAINGRVMKSDSDALMAYKSMKKANSIRITVQRNNQEKELNYEIY